VYCFLRVTENASRDVSHIGARVCRPM